MKFCELYCSKFNLGLFRIMPFDLQATNEVITRVPQATTAEMEAAVASCQKAYKTWSQSTVLTRQQCMFKFQQLIKDNMVGEVLDKG